MSGSSSSSPSRGTEVSSSRRLQATGRNKTVGSSLRQAAPSAREDQRTVRPRAVPSGMGASEPQRSAPVKSIPQEGRRSGCRPPASFMMAPTAPTPVAGEVVGLGVDADRVAGGGAKCCTVALAVVAYLGRWSPRRSCVPRRRRAHGPTPAIAEVGGPAPRRAGESVATVEVAGRAEQPSRRRP
jgi:hypothetical protein